MYFVFRFFALHQLVSPGRVRVFFLSVKKNISTGNLVPIDKRQDDFSVTYLIRLDVRCVAFIRFWIIQYHRQIFCPLFVFDIFRICLDRRTPFGFFFFFYKVHYKLYLLLKNKKIECTQSFFFFFTIVLKSNFYKNRTNRVNSKYD